MQARLTDETNVKLKERCQSIADDFKKLSEWSAKQSNLSANSTETLPEGTLRLIHHCREINFNPFDFDSASQPVPPSFDVTHQSGLDNLAAWLKLDCRKLGLTGKGQKQILYSDYLVLEKARKFISKASDSDSCDLFVPSMSPSVIPFPSSSGDASLREAPFSLATVVDSGNFENSSQDTNLSSSVEPIEQPLEAAKLSKEEICYQAVLAIEFTSISQVYADINELYQTYLKETAGLSNETGGSTKLSLAQLLQDYVTNNQFSFSPQSELIKQTQAIVENGDFATQSFLECFLRCHMDSINSEFNNENFVKLLWVLVSNQHSSLSSLGKLSIDYASLRRNFIDQRLFTLKSAEPYLDLVQTLLNNNLYPLESPVYSVSMLEMFESEHWIRFKTIALSSSSSSYVRSKFLEHFFDLFLNYAHFNFNSDFFLKQNGMDLSQVDQGIFLKAFEKNMELYPITQMITNFMQAHHIMADGSFYQDCVPLFQALRKNDIYYADFFPLFRWGLKNSLPLAKRIACISLIFWELDRDSRKSDFSEALNHQINEHKSAYNQTIVGRLENVGKSFISLGIELLSDKKSDDKQPESFLPTVFDLDSMAKDYGFLFLWDYTRFLKAFSPFDASLSETFLKFFDLAFQKAKAEPDDFSSYSFDRLLKACKSQVSLLEKFYSKLVCGGCFDGVSSSEKPYKKLIFLAKFIRQAKNYNNYSKANFFIEFSVCLKTFTNCHRNPEQFIAIVNQVGFFGPYLNEYLIGFFHCNLDPIDNILPLVDALLNLGSAGDGEDESRTHYLLQFLEKAILGNLDKWNGLPEDQYLVQQRNVCLFLEHMQKKTQNLPDSDEARQSVLEKLDHVLKVLDSQFFTKIKSEETLKLSSSILEKQGIACPKEAPKSEQFYFENFKKLTVNASTPISDKIKFYQASLEAKVTFERQVSEKYDAFIKDLSQKLDQFKAARSELIEQMDKFSKKVIQNQKILSEQIESIVSIVNKDQSDCSKILNESNGSSNDAVKETVQQLLTISQSTQTNIQEKILAMQSSIAALECSITSERDSKENAESFLVAEKSYEAYQAEFLNLSSSYNQQFNEYQTNLQKTVLALKTQVEATLAVQQVTLKQCNSTQEKNHSDRVNLLSEKKASEIERSSITSQIQKIKESQEEKRRLLTEIDRTLQAKETDLGSKRRKVEVCIAQNANLIQSLHEVTKKAIKARKQAIKNLKNTFWYFLAEQFSGSRFTSLSNFSSSHMEKVNKKAKKLNQKVTELKSFRDLIRKLLPSNQVTENAEQNSIASSSEIFLNLGRNNNACFESLKNDPFVWFFERPTANSVLEDVEKMSFAKMNSEIQELKAKQVTCLNEQSNVKSQLGQLQKELTSTESKFTGNSQKIEGAVQALARLEEDIECNKKNLILSSKLIDTYQDFLSQLADIDSHLSQSLLSVPSIDGIKLDRVGHVKECLCNRYLSSKYRLSQIDEFFRSITTHGERSYILGSLLTVDTIILEAWVKKIVESNSNIETALNTALWNGLSALPKTNSSDEIEVLKKNILVLIEYNANSNWSVLTGGDTALLNFFKTASSPLLNEIGKILLKNSMGIDKELNDLLYFAAQKCDDSVIDLILEAGGDLLSTDPSRGGLTPLYHIISSRCLSFEKKAHYIKESYGKHQAQYLKARDRDSMPNLLTSEYLLRFSLATVAPAASFALSLLNSLDSSLPKSSELALTFDYSQILDLNKNTLLHQAILDKDVPFVEYLCQFNPQLIFLKNDADQFPFELLPTDQPLLWEPILDALIKMNASHIPPISSDLKECLQSFEKKLYHTFKNAKNFNAYLCVVKKFKDILPNFMDQHDYLVGCDNVEKFDRLLRLGFDPNALKQGKTVLHVLLESPHANFPYIERLIEGYSENNFLEKQIDKYQKNSYGQTPLMSLYSIMDVYKDSYDKVIEMLIKDSMPQSILQSFTQAVTSLSLTSPLVSQIDNKGLSTLHYAAKCGDLKRIWMIINDLPDREMDQFYQRQDDNGKTAMHYLVANANLKPGDVIEILEKLGKKTNIHVRDNNDRLPFHDVLHFELGTWLATHYAQLKTSNAPIATIAEVTKLCGDIINQRDWPTLHKAQIDSLYRAVCRNSDDVKDQEAMHQLIETHYSLFVQMNEARAKEMRETITNEKMERYKNEVSVGADKLMEYIVCENYVAVAVILDKDASTVLPESVNQATCNKFNVKNDSSLQSFWVNVVKSRKNKQLNFQQYGTGDTLLHALVLDKQGINHFAGLKQKGGIAYVTEKNHEGKTVMDCVKDLKDGTNKDAIYGFVLNAVKLRLCNEKDESIAESIIKELDFSRPDTLEVMLDLVKTIQTQPSSSPLSADKFWKFRDGSGKTLADALLSWFRSPNDKLTDLERLAKTFLDRLDHEKSSNQAIQNNDLKQALENCLEDFKDTQLQSYAFTPEMMVESVQKNVGRHINILAYSDQINQINKISGLLSNEKKSTHSVTTFFSSSAQTKSQTERLTLLEQTNAKKVMLYFGILLEVLDWDQSVTLPGGELSTHSLLRVSKEAKLANFYIDMVARLMQSVGLENPEVIVLNSQKKAQLESKNERDRLLMAQQTVPLMI